MASLERENSGSQWEERRLGEKRRAEERKAMSLGQAGLQPSQADYLREAMLLLGLAETDL